MTLTPEEAQKLEERVNELGLPPTQAILSFLDAMTNKGKVLVVKRTETELSVWLQESC